MLWGSKGMTLKDFVPVRGGVCRGCACGGRPYGFSSFDRIYCGQRMCLCLSVFFRLLVMLY